MPNGSQERELKVSRNEDGSFVVTTVERTRGTSSGGRSWERHAVESWEGLTQFKEWLEPRAPVPLRGARRRVAQGGEA